MRIVILMEDTCGDPRCEYEHGLSVYVETLRHRILVDTGASAKTLSNARELGVDLAGVDTVVLTHGHYDHSGGITAFRGINPKAAIYMQQGALGDFYHGERYIGIDKKIAQLPGVKLLDGDLRIDGELSVFTQITGRRFWPQSNLSLSEDKGGVRVQDEFAHEQCLVVQGEKNLLVSGCAHNGILNILDRYEEKYGGCPDVVASGFHMVKKDAYSPKEEEAICRTAEELREKDTVFYTGHCTGQKAIALMQPIMGEKMVQVYCGMEIFC
ncbi:hypothetical protein IMSAGC019_02846 [Lachnospiraceae bacterium]|nr:hypothetical protein IMSAGC019_02846 [Lachnospiraceae bacterium]